MDTPSITIIIENGKSDSDDSALSELYNETDVDITCPVATQDDVLNSTNKDKTIEDHNYGPATVADKACGNCGYFNQTASMVDCIEEGVGQGNSKESDVGYCTQYHFACSARNTCDSWMKGGPISDHIEEDDEEDKGNRRFI